MIIMAIFMKLFRGLPPSLSRDHQDHRDPKGCKVQRVNQDPREFPELMGNRVLKDQKEIWVNLECMEKREELDYLACQEPMV